MFCSVLFYSDEEIWVSYIKSELKCFNSVGKCINIIVIKLGDLLNDIVIINDGYLVYSDWKL